MCVLVRRAQRGGRGAGYVGYRRYRDGQIGFTRRKRVVAIYNHESRTLTALAGDKPVQVASVERQDAGSGWTIVPEPGFEGDAKRPSGRRRGVKAPKAALSREIAAAKRYAETYCEAGNELTGGERALVLADRPVPGKTGRGLDAVVKHAAVLARVAGGRTDAVLLAMRSGDDKMWLSGPDGTVQVEAGDIRGIHEALAGTAQPAVRRPGRRMSDEVRFALRDARGHGRRAAVPATQHNGTRVAPRATTAYKWEHTVVCTCHLGWRRCRLHPDAKAEGTCEIAWRLREDHVQCAARMARLHNDADGDNDDQQASDDTAGLASGREPGYRQASRPSSPRHRLAAPLAVIVERECGDMGTRHGAAAARHRDRHQPAGQAAADADGAGTIPAWFDGKLLEECERRDALTRNERPAGHIRDLDPNGAGGRDGKNAGGRRRQAMPDAGMPADPAGVQRPDGGRPAGPGTVHRQAGSTAGAKRPNGGRRTHLTAGAGRRLDATRKECLEWARANGYCACDPRGECRCPTYDDAYEDGPRIGPMEAVRVCSGLAPERIDALVRTLKTAGCRDRSLLDVLKSAGTGSGHVRRGPAGRKPAARAAC